MVGATSVRPTAASAPVTAAGGLLGRLAEVARPEGDLALDRPLEELVVGVLEHEPDRRGERVDGSLAVILGRRSRTRPAAGRRRPLRCLTSVVLPEPFWPTIATVSPGSIAGETPRSASTPLG